MIWQNPWAWLGLAALALPVLIHLLARRRARLQPFPTLRFLDASRLLPSRRTRPSDLLLLVLRLAIVTAAVAALAQPLLVTPKRTRTMSRTLARAIIVDTSASMMRTSSAGQRAIEVARRNGQNAAAGAATTIVMESAAPARALPGAVAWLNTQPGQREIVIVSDFQIGTLERTDLAVVPAEVGVRLQRIEAAAAAPIESVVRHGDGEIVARTTATQDRTDVEWSVRPAKDRSSGLILLAGTGERADAALRAALQIGLPRTDTARLVAIVHTHYEQRASIVRDAQPLDRPWMGDVIRHLGADPTLAAAADDARVNVASLDSTRFVAAARSPHGMPVAFAASGTVNGRHALLLFPQVDAASLTAAALIAAAAHAISVSPAITELEPENIPAAVLQEWERPPSAAAPDAKAAHGASDGRWLWLLVLALLGIDTWLRRAQPKAAQARTVELPHERVA